MMADRSPASTAERERHGSTRDQEGTANDDSSHVPKLLKADVHRPSDGFETFKYARASAPKIGDAQTPPVQKQPEARQQKPTPRQQYLQRKAHGTASLLTMDNLSHLQKPSFPFSMAPSKQIATSIEPHQSAPTPVEQPRHSPAIQGMSHLLSSIQEASEPPTSSPQQDVEERSQHMHDGSSRGKNSAYLEGRTPLKQRDGNVAVERSATHSTPHNLPAPGPSQLRRTTSNLSGSARVAPSIRPLPTPNASATPTSNIFRVENPFKRTSTSQTSRSNTPIPAASLSVVPPERPSSPLRITTVNMSSTKRPRKQMTSKQPRADSEDDYHFSDLEDFPIQSMQPSAKKSKVVPNYTPLITDPTPRPPTTSSSSSHVSVDPPVEIHKSPPPQASQRVGRPAGVYKDRRRDQRCPGVTMHASIHQTSTPPVPSQSAQSTTAKQVEYTSATASRATVEPSYYPRGADAMYNPRTADAMVPHVASSPSSSHQTATKSLDPETDKMLHDVFNWCKTFHSNASSLEKLNEKVARKSKKLEEQELELKTLRNLKDESQALQMDTFELRFAKEELEMKIKVLQSDLQKATEALQESRLLVENEKTAKEADLKAGCIRALNSLVDLCAPLSEGTLQYENVFTSRLNNKALHESTFTIFEEVVKNVFRDVKAKDLLSKSKLQELEENLRKVSLDLVRSQHLGDTASSENARLRDKIAELDKALKEARTALQTMERRATQLQNAQNENHVALRDAMNTINELKKQIETSKENSEQIRKLIQEKAAVNELLAASKEQLKGVQERLSVLSTQFASALQDLQAQRSRADGLQGEYDAERRMYSHRLAEMDGHYKSLQVQMADKEIELVTLKLQYENLEAQYQEKDSKLQGLKFIQDSARDGENLNGQLLLFLRDVWNRLHSINQAQSGVTASENNAPTDVLNLKLAITSMIQETRTLLETLQGRHAESQEEKRVLAEQLEIERSLRIAADLLVQKHLGTINSNELQMRAVLHDHEARQSQANSQLQDLLAERAKQEHCNGTLTARLAMLAEAESRQREEIQKLRSELREETTKVHTAEVPTNRPSIGSMHTERLRLQTRLELMKKDFASEVAFLKGQLEDTNRAEGMRLAEIKTISAEKGAMQETLSQTSKEMEIVRAELLAARSEIASMKAQSLSQIQMLDEREKGYTVQINKMKSALLEESKMRDEGNTRQQSIQQDLEQSLTEQKQLREALAQEGKLVSDLQAELEIAKKAQLSDPNSPERKEQTEQVKKHYRQEMSVKDNEIKKLQRKLRDATDRQARLSEQISQLKNHPTLFQSQSKPLLSSPPSPEAASTKSAEDPDSSLTAIPSSSSPDGCAASEAGKSSSIQAAEVREKGNDLLLVQSPVLFNGPLSISDLARSSSPPESSQSSLSESQIIKPNVKESIPEVPLARGTNLPIPDNGMNKQEEEQSQGWLRRSTRRSRSGSAGPARMDDMSVHAAEKPNSGSKRTRRS